MITPVRFRVIFSLFILMGVSWTTEIISFVSGGSFEVWAIPDILNILTGFFIFVIFVCKESVWRSLQQRIPCLKRCSVFCQQRLCRFCPCCNKRQGSGRSPGRRNRGRSGPSGDDHSNKDPGYDSSDVSKSNASYQSNPSLETGTTVV